MDPNLKTLRQEISSAISGLNPEQLKWHDPGKWSTTEVLEHLYLTYTGTTKGFQRLLQRNQVVVSPPNFRQRIAHLLVLSFQHLPSGREAPSMSRPRGLPMETVVAEIASKIDEMDQAIGRCEEIFGRGKLLDHPILGPLTGKEWRKFHLVHGRHHLKQIRARREASAGR